MPSASGIVILAVAFAIAFLLARVAGKWFRRRGPAQRQGLQDPAESRQVRRARERRGRG